MLDAQMSDEQKCPLCDQPNRCAMAEDESVSACWCTSIKLTEDVLEAVPAKDRGVRCVCATCARALATASPNQALPPTAPLRPASDVDVN
jgi:Cysteine-rich CWC